MATDPIVKMYTRHKDIYVQILDPTNLTTGVKEYTLWRRDSHIYTFEEVFYQLHDKREESELQEVFDG